MTHRRVLAWSVLFLFSSAVALNCSPNDTTEFGKSSGGVAPCKAGTEKCACGTGDTCVAGLVCLSELCVAETPAAVASSGAGGAAASSVGSGGGGVAGTGGATVAASSTSATGGGGASATTTAASTAASTGSGGAPVGNCMDPDVIDDFSSCDTSICNINGRSGMWHTVSNIPSNPTMFMVSVPPSGWLDMTCAALATGGPTVGVPAGQTPYSGMGIQLASGNTYDLSRWAGMSVLVESSHTIAIQLVAADGGVFQTSATVGGAAGTSVAYPILFNTFTKVDGTPGSGSLDLSKVTDMQFMSTDQSMFGYAIHNVSLTH